MTVPREHLEYERVEQLMRDPNAVFVFGSNLKGKHGAGAARIAVQQYGALPGYGEGWVGRSYAIPTKVMPNHRYGRDLASIAMSVRTFLATARESPSHTFVVTRVGCGLAGYTDAQMAPLFVGYTPNVQLPPAWIEILRAVTHNTMTP